MKYTLTMVPTLMPPIMASDKGNCRSAPRLPVNRNGAMAKIVVNDVMIMGFSRRLPAIMIALFKW